MSKRYYVRNSGQSWTPKDKRELRDYAAHNTPTRVAAFKLGRTEEAVRTMASELGISLKPTNQSPYGTKK